MGGERGGQLLVIAAYHDNTYGAYPLRIEAARQWLEGRVPLWNPYKRAGAPLLADIVSGVLYPGNVPFLLDRGAQRYRPLDLVAVLHFVLAALAMYAFLRTIEVGRGGAFLGGLVFAGNGMMTWWTSLWIQAQNALVWAPLILLALHRAAVGGAFVRWMVIGGAIVALQVFAGYPEFSFYSGLVAAGYALSLVPGRSGHGPRAIAALVIIYAIGIALAAVQLLPTAELASISVRGARVNRAEFLSFAVAPSAVVGWAVPGIPVFLTQPFPTVGTAYFGMPAVVFAVEGLRGLDRRRIFFALLLLTGFVLAIGPHTPVGAVAYGVPGLNAFRYSYKHLFEIMVALPVLAALGADAFLVRRRGSAATVAVAAVGVVALGLWFLLLGGRLDTVGSATASDPIWRTVVATGATAACLPFVLAGRRGAAFLVALAVLWISYAGNRGDVVQHGDWPAVRSAKPASALVELLRGDHTGLPFRYALLTSLTPLDVFRTHRQELLTADYPTEFEVSAVHGCCPFLWAPLAAALSMREEGVFDAPRRIVAASNQMLDVLAVRYVGTTRSGQARLMLGYPVAWENGDFVVFERPQAFAPVRFVDAAVCAAPEEARRGVHSSEPDLRTTAHVDCGARGAPPAVLAAGATGEVDVVHTAPGQLHFRTRLTEGPPGFLVVSQSDLPGWLATVDGQSVPLYRVDGLVQGVVVPSGAHEVALRYRPTSVVIGIWITLVAMVAGGALLVRGVWPVGGTRDGRRMT